MTAGRPLERRQLTIMFTDLVNSTALSDSMDPEDFRVLIEAHRTAAADPIKCYDGVVARYLGDGMLIYFGYPEAHEDDPDRAVRAGLEIVEATKAMNQRWVGEGQGKIAVRIGIHTGIVVVGDVIKKDVQEPMAVFGNPPSMASRLQALAVPNSVVLSEATKNLLRPTVRCSPRGKTILKGISKPVEIYMASETEGRSIGDPLSDSRKNVIPFVNREKELAALRLGWVSAKRGEGKAFLLAGDPGIGKSRLIRAIEERVVAKPYRWLTARTSPYATNSDFFAFSELFHMLLQSADPARSEADGYALLTDVLIEQGIADPNHGLGFAHLLGIEIPGEVAPSSLQPERLRDLTLGAIVAWLQQHAADEPLVLVIEDLHWADASTLETLKLLLAKIASCPILLVMSSREEGVLGENDDHVKKIPINRLPPDYAKTLLDHVVHEADLPETAIDTLLERAAGVPLFLEELPKPVLEGGRAAGLNEESDPVAALPATLRDSLMAQLDRMGVGKSVAQTGAVLGHSFDEALLRRVWSGGPRHLQEGLDALTEAGLLARHGTSPEATYAFKHALLAEIAYDSLLREECRQIHRRTADALVAHFPTLTETRPELIARHYAAARDASVAFDYWMKAGKAAARRSANTEAIGHLRSAEAELETLKAAGVGDLDERWLYLYASRAPVLVALEGWAASQVEETYRASLKLSQKHHARQRDEFDAWIGLCNVHALRGNLDGARAATKRMHDIASSIGAKDLVLRWHRPSGFCEFLSGRFGEAIKHYEASLSFERLNNQPHHKKVRDTIGGIRSYSATNREVMSYSTKSWSHWFLGETDTAKDASSTAISIAERAEHPFSMCYALCLAASLEQCRHHPSLAAVHAEKASAISAEYNFPYWIAWANIVKGWAISMLGDPASGIRLLSKGIAEYESTNATQMRGYSLVLLAEAYQKGNRWRDVADTANIALAEMDRTGIVFYQAEAYRLLSEGLLSLGSDRTTIVHLLTKALRLAERQHSLPLSIRISCSLLNQIKNRRFQRVVRARAFEMLQRAGTSCPKSELVAAEKRLEVASIGC